MELTLLHPTLTMGDRSVPSEFRPSADAEGMPSDRGKACPYLSMSLMGTMKIMVELVSVFSCSTTEGRDLSTFPIV